MAISEVAYFLGPGFTFCCFALILFGVVCAQAYSYWATPNGDTLFLKLCVASVCILEALHTALVLHLLYSYLITPVFTIQVLDHVIWSAPGVLLSAICMIAATQGFYIFRIYQLSQHNLYATIAPTFSLTVRAGLAITSATLLGRAGTWSSARDSHKLHLLFTLGLIMNVFTDALITLLFTYYLHTCKSYVERTQSILRKWMIYTVNTGMLAIFASTAVIIMFLQSPTLMFAGMYTLVGKVYAFSMLAQLNTRNNLRQQCACGLVQKLNLQGSNMPTLLQNSSPQGNIQVSITKDVTTDQVSSSERSSGDV